MLRRLEFLRERRAPSILILLPLLLTGCVVNTAEYDQVEKLRTGQYEIVDKNELSQLRHDAEFGRRTGRFQIFVRDQRTWRFDTAAGKACVLLTTTED